MDNRIKQYLFDIEQSISDVKSYMSAVKSLQAYEEDKLIRRAVERELEIIGEALNRILKIDPNITIPNARKIISLRNKIIHGYDEVDNVIIYTVATKHVDILKEDIEKL
ncbi:HepT-like ribonuclease domain-containing protein [Phaeodactylibacter xiamenensis]|uniref:HepT-like ribonuclease domain-containing protein n=1 Tax=Phaeodactylibacter xiamenensis TaxID=1524460 RepID=UPI003CCBD831